MNFRERDFNTSLSSLNLDDLDKVSSHKNKSYESITDRSYNEVNKMEINRVGNKLDCGLEPLALNRKRSKPRRLSGLQGANITEDNFKQSRPFLPRDDSIFLLKQRTTNAIPMIVPLVQADSPKKQESIKENPLSRIQRRRKPRRFSGDAVQNETRPILVRDDSVFLTKKKLAGMVPGTLEAPPAGVPLTVAVEHVPVVQAKTKEDVKKIKNTRKTPVRASSAKAPRLTLRQKQQGYVRQNSCGARTA